MNNSSDDDYDDDDDDDDNVGRICARLLKDYNKSSLRSRTNYPDTDKDKKKNDMNDATDNHHDKIRVMINNNDDDNEHCTIIKKEECTADPSSNNRNMNFSSASTSSYHVDQTIAHPLTPQEHHQHQKQIRKQQVIQTLKIVWLQRLYHPIVSIKQQHTH